MGTRCLRGTAGPPFPGGYKYGALQIGVWATGRQPVTLKEACCWETNVVVLEQSD
jgi:hypothetical protein